jgi:hypothetical protein
MPPDNLAQNDRPPVLLPSEVDIPSAFGGENIALARLLVNFKKPLHITDGEVVISTKDVKGKTVELYYEYAKTQVKATQVKRGECE